MESESESTREKITGGDGSQPSRTLSGDLRHLAEHCKDRSVSLAEMVEVLHLRGYRFVLMLLCLPFLTPIPLPGLSTPIGLLILLIGFRLALNQSPRLPRRLLAKHLPAGMLPRVLSASSRLVSAFERLSKPRLRLFYRHEAFQRLGGVLIAICGLKLLLPIPVPMSNFFPAVSVALLAAGSFEEDGLVFLAGVLCFVASAAYFTLLALGGFAAVSGIWQRVVG